MRLIRLIVSLAILLPGVKAFCQTKSTCQSISIAQGLSQGMVFDILQSKDGFIWVATKNGLNRYDGYGFKVFTNDPYDKYSLSSNIVTELFEDSKGRIWAGTENAGLNVLDRETGKFYRIESKQNDAKTLSGNNIRPGMAEMPDGRFLVAAQNAGFNIVSLPEDYFTKSAPAQITRLKLPGNTEVYGIGRDKNNRIYIGGFNNLVYLFNPLDNSFTQTNEGKLFNNGYVNEDGTFWINKRLFLEHQKELLPLFDTTKETAGNIVFRHREFLWPAFHQEPKYYDISRRQSDSSLQWNENVPVSAGTKILYPFLIDKCGLLWGGTRGYGLIKCNMAKNSFKRSVQGYSVRFIIAKSDTELFLGAYPYEWRKLDRDSVQPDPFRSIFADQEIDNLVISKTGDYWIRTDDKGLFQYNTTTKKLTGYPGVIDNKGEGDKQPMMEDRRGNIWFPALDGVFSLINTTTGKVNNFSINTGPARLIPEKAICTALYEDMEGVFWVGTAYGFARLIFSADDFTKPSSIKWYSTNSSDRNSLNNNNVSCFMDDPKEPLKYLWVCTKGGGLNRLEKNKGNFLHFTQKEGLPNDVVYGILNDDAGNIWGSTNRGIFCLQNRTENQWESRNFTKSDGLQDDEFNTGAFARLTDGHLAFGGVNGMNVFNPNEVLSVGFIPNVFITDIRINNQPLAAGNESGVLQNNIEQTKRITFTHLQDILTLEFSALDFTAPEQNKYRYQLEGIDKDWVESGTRRSATYVHLSPGTYTFKVQGSNSQGSWSDKVAELKIKVLPPWWKSWLAYLLYLALLAIGIRWYFRYITNRAKLNEQLNYEKREARRMKELDNAKTQLYTNITHEFRTPLTVILGMAQQIADHPDTHLEKGTDMILRNGRSLLKLVNEMLDLSKLESGKMTLQPIKGDLIVFLRYIVEAFHSLAENQNKQFHFLSELESYHTEYDTEKIRQIISNLLSNALKFTPEKGNIYISINVRESSAKNNNHSFLIKIMDTGIGIPEDKLPFIFDRFYQLNNSNTRAAEGTGIGLSLTLELVKLMKGTISVKSPPMGATKGTEFTVELPLEKLPITDEIMASPYLNEKESDKYKEIYPESRSHEQTVGKDEEPLILLVEDNADVVAYTAFCLPDYRLAVASDGMEGFDLAVEMIPDLIITDIMMPRMDGFELLKKLRSDQNTCHIPIIMLTAKTDMESKMEGISRGADAYLEKPFNNEELRIRIKKLLELRKSLQQFYLAKSGLSNIPASASGTIKNEQSIAATPQAEDKFVFKIREIVEAHISDTGFNIELLCKEVFMSHSNLHRKLDALTGCSPNKFIRIIRLKKAKELLKNKVTSISSIALDCGFSDPSYFARVFKQEFDVTPNEWKENG